jgi:hypothetical protein
MKRFVGVLAAITVVALVAGLALAHGPGGRLAMGPGMMGAGPGQGMGPGMMGHGGMMGGGRGMGDCPGLAAGGTVPAAIGEEKARELAQEYADRYLKGFAVERVLPFTMRHGTGYAVELKGPNDEVRTFHVNPWGNVMPFGGPGRRGA